MHNEQELKNTPEYRSGMFRIVSCPVCGHPTLICTGSACIAAGNMTMSCKRRTRSHPATECPCRHTAHYIKLEAHYERDYLFQKSR